MTIRLDKYLANLGLTSRRGVEVFLREHKIVLNGKRVFEHGVRIDPNTDKIIIDGQPAHSPQLVYYLVNKPVGYITTVSDELDRKTVMSLVQTKHRVYPVGRLDFDSHGLVLLTNDGELTYRLTHPKFEVPKTYHLTITGRVTSKQIWMLSNGVKLKDGITQPTQVKRIYEDETKTILEVIIHEGRNRQLRRMCKAINLELIGLKRVAFGPLTLEGLKQGQSRELTEAELAKLKEL